jgi:hypothetical protein
MTRQSYAAGVLTAFLAACLAAATPLQTPAAQTQAQSLVPAPDHSLDLKGYLDLGLPAIEKAWTAAEYSQAGKVMDTLAKKDPTQLPRSGSARSGAVFSRLVDPANIFSLGNKAIPPYSRIETAGGIMQESVSLFRTYAGVSSPALCFDTELMKLGIYLLRQQETATLISDEILRSDLSVAQDPKRKDGHAQIRIGMGQTSCGLVQMLADSGTIRDQVAVRAAGELLPLLAQAYALLPPTEQDKVRQQLADAIQKGNGPDRKEALRSLQAAL